MKKLINALPKGWNVTKGELGMSTYNVAYKKFTTKLGEEMLIIIDAEPYITCYATPITDIEKFIEIRHELVETEESLDYYYKWLYSDPNETGEFEIDKLYSLFKDDDSEEIIKAGHIVELAR